LELKERLGFRRAAVALARKLAVIMHAMFEAALEQQVCVRLS
jgi:hypothetical protein